MSAPVPWAEPGPATPGETAWPYAPASGSAMVPREERQVAVAEVSEAEDGKFAQFWALLSNALGSEGDLVVTRLPARRSWLELRVTFEELASQWRQETAMEALPSRKAMNFSYQSIIGMGPDALPFILASLADEVDDWFWALTAITRSNVAAGTTTMKDATTAWLEWGKAERYVA